MRTRARTLGLGTGKKWQTRSFTLIREKVYRTFGSRFKVYVELDNARARFMVWSDTFTVEGRDALNGEEKTAAESHRKCSMH